MSIKWESLFLLGILSLEKYDIRKSHKNKNATITAITKKEAGTVLVGLNIQNPTDATKVTTTEIKFCLDFINSLKLDSIPFFSIGKYYHNMKNISMGIIKKIMRALFNANVAVHGNLLSFVLGHGSALYLDYRRTGRDLQAEEKEVMWSAEKDLSGVGDDQKRTPSYSE